MCSSVAVWLILKYNVDSSVCVCVLKGRLPYLYSGSAVAAAAAVTANNSDQLSQPPPAHMGIPPLHIDHKTGMYSLRSVLSSLYCVLCGGSDYWREM